MTTVTDNFTGTNGTQLPTYSANWTTTGNAAAGSYLILSNGATSPVDNSLTLFFNSWNASFANNQYAQLTISQVGGAGQFFGLALRVSNGNAYTVIGDAGNWRVQKTVAFAVTTIMSGTFTLATSDVLYLSAVGTGLSFLRNGSSLYTGTDSSLSAGSVGLASTSESGSGASIIGDSFIGSDVFGFGGLTPDTRNRLVL